MPKRNNHRKKDTPKPVKKKNDKKNKRNQDIDEYGRDGESVEKYVDEFKGLREIMKAKNMVNFFFKISTGRLVCSITPLGHLAATCFVITKIVFFFRAICLS